MEVGALKRILQIPFMKKQKEVSLPSREQKKRRPPRGADEKGKGRVDIKI